VALRETFEVVWSNIFNAPLVNLAWRYMPGVD
jgi:hypothetical protein